MRREEDQYSRTIRSIQQVQEQLEHTSNVTSQIIHQQGEDVNRIADSQNTVEHNISLTSRFVRGLESFSGRVANFFSANPVPSKSILTGGSGTAAAPQSRTSDDQQQDPLDDIASSLGRLKEKSLRISQEIERQNASLQKTSDSVDVSVSTLTSQHKRILG